MDHAADKVISVARAEAERMQAAVAGAAGDETVRMSVDQFSSLARLITVLCDRQPEPDRGGFGDPRYWVPLDSFARTREAARRLERECARLREGAAASPRHLAQT